MVRAPICIQNHDRTLNVPFPEDLAEFGGMSYGAGWLSCSILKTNKNFTSIGGALYALRDVTQHNNTGNKPKLSEVMVTDSESTPTRSYDHLLASLHCCHWVVGLPNLAAMFVIQKQEGTVVAKLDCKLFCIPKQCRTVV